MSRLTESKKVLVVINEQHSVLESQKEELDGLFGEGEWERLNIPAAGLNQKDIEDLVEHTIDDVIVFLSPIPLFIALRHAWSMYNDTYLFFNPNREKKELPNGKIIFAVPQDGWELLQTGQVV